MPTYVPANGLIGWWSFTGNANDISGNGNNGIVSGASLSNDRFGNSQSAYDFNGTTSYISVTSTTALNLLNDFTISSWFKADSIYDIPSTVKMIACKHRDEVSSDGWAYGLWNNSNSSATRGMVNCQGTNFYTAQSFPRGTNGDVYVNNWYHYVATFSKTTNILSYYINGVRVDTITIPFSFVGNTQDVLFGAQWMNIGTSKMSFFNGKLDDIGIWSRELSQQEIALLYTGCIDTITTQPVNQSGYKGNNKNFTLAHSGTNYNYQWQSNSVALGWQNVPNANQYSGATTNNLTVNSLTVSNHNQLFRIITSKTGCADTSNIVKLTISDVTTDSLKILRLQNDSSRLTVDSINYLARVNKLRGDSSRLTIDSIIYLARINKLSSDSSRLTNDSINYLSSIIFLKSDTTSKGISIRQLQTDLTNKHDTVYIVSSITSDTLKISIHTGISSASPTINSLKVYPNPASTLLHLDLEKPGYFTAKLSSVTGQSIITPTTGTIDVSGLANGVYTLTIYDSNNKLISTNKVSIIK